MKTRIALSSILILLLMLKSASAFYPMDTDGLFTIDGNIGVGFNDYENPRYLLFDSKGTFIKDFSFRAKKEALDEGLLAVTSEGNFWFSVEEYSSEANQVTTTNIYIFDRNGQLLQDGSVKGHWDSCYQSGKLFLAKSNLSPESVLDPEIVISVLDLESGKLVEYARLPTKTRFVEGWSISPAGNIYLLAHERDNKYLESYSPSARLLWREALFELTVEEIDVSIARVDGAGRIYLIANPEQEDSYVLIYNERGKIETKIVEPFLRDVQGNGSQLYVLSGIHIVKLSKTGKLLSQWTYTPPIFGESWEEKWKRESRAKLVTSSSTTDELLMAVVYGQQGDIKNASSLVIKRGSSVLPTLIAKVADYPETSLSFLLMEMSEKYENEIYPIALKKFEEGNVEQRNVLLPFLITESRPVAESVKEFLVELQSGNEEDQELAEQYMLQAGIGAGILDNMVAQLRNTDPNEYKKGDLQWRFLSNPEAAFQTLAPILRNPADPLRELSRDILIEALSINDYSYGGEARISSSVAEELVKWTSDSDEFVSAFAAIVLTGLGTPGYLDMAVSGAAHDQDLVVPLIEGFPVIAKRDPVKADEYSKEILSFAVQRFVTSRDKYEDVRLFSDLFLTPLPGMRRAALELVTDIKIPANVRHSVSYSVSPYIKEIPRTEILKILKTFDSMGDADENLYRFLGEVGRAFPDDKEIRNIIRERMYYALSIADSQMYSTLLSNMEGLVEEEDLAILIPLLEIRNGECGNYLTRQVLELMGEIGAVPEVQNQLLLFLHQSEFAVPAAKLLAQDGNPEALNVLIAALQAKDDFKLNARHFRSYGATAEQLLIPLMGSSSDLIADRAILVLGELKSKFAYPIIREQFDDSLRTGRILDCAVIAALMFYGEDPWKEIADRHECTQKTRCENFPKVLSDRAVQQLEKMLFEEQSPQRAEFLICLMESEMLGDSRIAAFERLRMNHPIEGIRQQIPVITHTSYISD